MEILSQLLAAEKEDLPPKAKSPSSRTVAADHWSRPVLLERAAYLRELARLGDGSSSETLKEFPLHSSMLSVRCRDGVAELHENFADIFFVLDGRATLVTGGNITGAKRAGPGEMRGSAIEGGTRQELRAGDVAHVPAGEAHQMLVASDITVACLVFKVQEKP